jgi:two-component system, OmpR family, response regulator CpxR
MSIVAAFSGTFCRAEEIMERVAAESGSILLTDMDVVDRAAALSSIPAENLKRCFSMKASIFNPFTRERERSMAWLKLAVAEHCQKGALVLHGFSSHLIPASIPHVLRICLISDMPARVRTALKKTSISKAKASDWIGEQDRERAAWVQTVTGVSDPWNPALYDMVLPVNDSDMDNMVSLIRKGLGAAAVYPTKTSRAAADSFLRTARIEAALAAQGHVADVSLEDEVVVLTIDRPVLMRERLEAELAAAVRAVHPTGAIEVRTPPAGEGKEPYRSYSQNTPSKVLLVDDEREFIQTLSERLEMRDIGAAVTFDGESALDLVEDDAPEVMLLDLQMPGINGIEVLKRVKAEHPEIEVVILTGHGTEKDRDVCMELGAYAYLEKPVDIEVLSETLKQANDKIRRNLKKNSKKHNRASAENRGKV